MKTACRRCRQSYELAVIVERTAWMAIPPFEKSLCANCEIGDARTVRSTK